MVIAGYNAFADTAMHPAGLLSMEDGRILAERLGPRHVITDDNMGAEWTEVLLPPWRQSQQ
jgi:hypothetical protein